MYHLRYFVKLAKLEHYTRAAEELMITQPSLSHAIATLEQELGVALFEKVGRNIQLTKYGKAFLTGVEASLQQLDASVNSLKMTGSGEGTIELGFVRALGIDFVPRMVESFLMENPGKNIHFNLSTGSGLSKDLLAGLKAQQYDMVMCSRIDREPDIEFVPIATQDLVVIVPEGHELADRDSIKIQETILYPQVIFKKKSGLRYIVDDIFDEIGAYPEVTYEVEEDQVVAGFVAHGFGIAIVPYMHILEHMPVKTLQIESPRWERYFYIAALKDAYRAPVVEKFRRFVIDNADL